MDYGANPGLADQLAAALDWWRDAGVDGDLHDEPQCWLAESAPEPALADSAPASNRPPKPQPAPAIAAEPAPLDRSNWPADLEGFAPWWLSEAWLDQGQTQGRVPPRGVRGADLMIVVPEPEPGDSERLLSGPQGRLLDAMLAAMGLAPDAIYLASALPRHTPHADWAGLNRAGMGEVLRHHVSLVAPRRLIAFGRNASSLLDTGPANKPELSTKLHHLGGSVPLLALRELAILLERPRWKAGVWQDWLAWNFGDSAVPDKAETVAT
jgi:uracil-DNA glycosylase